MSKIDVDALQKSVNILDVIGDNISLTKRGAEYYGICPFHDDTTESLQVSDRKQIYKCFACNAGGDVIDYLMRSGSTFIEACEELRTGVTKSGGKIEKREVKARKENPWKQILPPSPPTDINHYRHGKPHRQWSYRTAAGKLIGYVCRFDLKEGKEIMPFIYASDGKRHEWRWQGFDKPRPLYNLDLISVNKEKTVLILEGEKTADASTKLILNGTATCWIGGAKAIKETDWTPLYGRNIILWPDNDKEQKYGEKHEKAGQIKPFYEQPGNAAMLEIETILKPHCPIIKWVKNSEQFPHKWDLADATWTPEQATTYVRANLYERGKEEVKPKAAEAINIPATPPPKDPEPPEEIFDNTKHESDHFRFLGFDKSESGGQRFHFFVKSSSSVFSYSASSLSKVNLMTMAPYNWWEERFAAKRGLDLEASQNWIISKSSLAGPFDERRIRGRGAWIEGKNVVLHGGNKLIINGQNFTLKNNNTKYIYEAGRELGFNIENPLSTKDASKILDIIGLLNWERPINKYLFAGWCVLAPVCGALTWRPHIWLTGPAGSGKSWVFKYIVRRLLGQSAMAVQSETTEAGIRQMLGHDALPIVFDEAEGPERRDSERIQMILNLMRAASAEDGGIMAKGSAGGVAKTYRIRSCFAFASISVGVYLQSDRSRVSVLGLINERDKALKDQRWNQLKTTHRDVINEASCAALRARTVNILPTIIKNAETFSDAVAFELGEQRAGDQLGTLLAGAYSLVSDKIISYEDACKWVKEKDWSEEKGNEAYRDEFALLGYLMEQITRIETPIGTIERSLGELVQLSLQNDVVIEPERAKDRLKRLGLKVDGDYLLISNTSDWIKKNLANTQWSKNHNKILQRLPEAIAVNSIRFGPGMPTRAVKIPLNLVLETP